VSQRDPERVVRAVCWVRQVPPQKVPAGQAVRKDVCRGGFATVCQDGLTQSHAVREHLNGDG
jgi:hypothetical protein